MTRRKRRNGHTHDLRRVYAGTNDFDSYFSIILDDLLAFVPHAPAMEQQETGAARGRAMALVEPSNARRGGLHTSRDDEDRTEQGFLEEHAERSLSRA